MGTIELIILAVALAMDAFAVSITQGLCLTKSITRCALIIGAFFGFFQGFMPLIGYFLGLQFSSFISSFDHWIAFILLGLIGAKMIYESLNDEEKEESTTPVLNYPKLFTLAIATSIDALAVGISFAFLEVEIISAVLVIGIITFVISFVGVRMGHLVGNKFKNNAEILGGVVLILIGLKILLEHLNILVI